MRALLLSALALVVLAPPAAAVPIVVTDGPNLVRTDTNSLGSTTTVPVTGMASGEVLVGIDQRPATGQLYGIAAGPSDQDRMYVIDPLSGAATPVGAAGAFTLVGTEFGTDFNPVPDRIRVVSDAEQNLRLNPNDGTLTFSDDALNPGNPNVVAAAYTNNVAGATTTTLFGIDSATNMLVRQGGANGASPSPNGGTLTNIGPLDVTPANANIGFDIGADGVAFATITTSGPTETRLYGINTSSGHATNLGLIGTGATSYLGLAIMPARIRLASATVSATEGNDALFEVTRNAPAAGPVSVEYSTAAGTAAVGEDFTPVFGTVSWGAGESGSKTIGVPVSADAGAEGDETFSLTISGVTGADAVLGSPATATATIAANEAGPTLQFSSPAVEAREGEDATLEVTRVGSAAHPVSVEYTTPPGSAAVNDYTATTGTLSWAAGDGAPKTITVPITQDTAGEDAETFAVNLLLPSGATVGEPSSATVTIAQSDGGAGPGGGSGQEPTLTLAGPKRQKLRTVRRKGLRVVARTNRACSLDASVRRQGKTKRIGRIKRELEGKKKLRIKLKKKARRKLRKGQLLDVVAICTNDAGPSDRALQTYKLKR
jgi:hypothetical protein